MRSFNRRAEWIWRPRGLEKIAFGGPTPPFADETNRYVYFRKAIMIDQVPSSVPVHVSADGRYQLFVNGHFVGRGPARSNPLWQCVDAYDLAPHLRAGCNVIAALVHSYGRNTAWYELPPPEQARAFGCGGFFLQGEAGDQPLDTDASWRCRVSEAWQQEVPSGSLGFSESYDARRAPPGWAEADFDDSGWEHAEVLWVHRQRINAEVVPFPVLVPRAIPPLREELRRPASILVWGEVVQEGIAPVVADQLARETMEPSARRQVRHVEALVSGDGATEIVTGEDRAVTIVVDFGRVVTGYIHLDLDGPAGAIVDFTCDERLREDGRVRIGEGIPGFDTKMAHRYVLREGRQVWERFEWNGFRYLQATFRNCARPLRAHALAVNFTTYPVAARGSFACSDPLLNRIWEAGAYTLQLCMQDAYTDCPSREQRQWIGDAYVQTLINYAVFGDARLAAQCLRHIAYSQRPNGLTMPAAPSDFAATAVFHIPDFCLYWIMTIERYADYTGDVVIVDELYPSVVKAIAWFEQFLGEDDLLTDVPHWVFIDWAELDRRGQVTALNAQFVAALRAAARFAHLTDSRRDAQRFADLAQRVTDAINHHLWDEARGVYLDARGSRRVSQHANAAAIAFDVAPTERWARALSYVTDEVRLVMTRALGESDLPAPPFDEERNVVLAQPFYMHHVHRALCKAGQQQQVIDNIRRRWGAMLANGDSTLWETWRLSPLTSMCHAFSATPTFDLSTEVLGVTPLDPGFRRVRVAPHPADLGWARGAFPTPLGEVAVEWRREGERFDLKVDVPEGAEAEILLPARGVSSETGSYPAIVGGGSHRFTTVDRDRIHRGSGTKGCNDSDQDATTPS